MHVVGHSRFLIALAIFGASVSCFAQSAIFNAPSTDTQPYKTFYIEADFFSHLDSFQRNGFQFFGPSMEYGIGKDVELGTNLYVIRSAGPTSVELQPNVKWRYFADDKSGIAATVGSLVLVPLNKAAGSRPSAMFYANISKKFKGAKDLRLTGGAYTMVGTETGFGTKRGFMAGLEQPITDKVTILADWTTGRNRFGYASLGLGLPLTKKTYLGFGYSIGNAGKGNNYFTAFYGYTF